MDINEKSFLCPTCEWAAPDWCNIRYEVKEAQTECSQFKPLKSIKENICDIKTSLNFLFDYHGVLEKYPLLFRPMLKSLRCTGHKVYIASGSMFDKLSGELKDSGYKRNVHYDLAISVPIYLMLKGGVEITFDEKWEPWTDDETWWKSKSKICEEYKIDIMIDDSEQYFKYLNENVAFFHLK